MDTCWYCKQRTRSSADGVAVYVHKIKEYELPDRIDEVLRKQTAAVKWETTTVDVPRCGPCASRHKRYEMLIVGLIGILALAWLGLLVSYWLPISAPWSRGEPPAGIGERIGLFLGLAFCSAVILGAPMAILGGLMPPSKYKAMTYLGVKRLLEQGWKEGNRPDNVEGPEKKKVDDPRSFW